MGGDDGGYFGHEADGRVDLELSLSTVLKALSGSALLTAPSLSRGLSKGNAGNEGSGFGWREARHVARGAPVQAEGGAFRASSVTATARQGTGDVRGLTQIRPCRVGTAHQTIFALRRADLTIGRIDSMLCAENHGYGWQRPRIK